MLIFKGEIKEENKKQILKKQILYVSAITIVMATILNVIFIVISIITKEYFLLFFIVPFLYVIAVLAALPPSKKRHDLIFPTMISISGNTIRSQSVKFDYVRKISHVKKVIKTNNYYQICFLFPHKNSTFICQTDLLDEGSLEEFESLFKGKIIKK